VVGGTPTTRRLAHTESQIMARDGGWLAGSGPLGLRRSALVAAPLAFLLLVGGGVAARSMMEPAPAKVAAAEKRPQAPSAATARLELAVLPWGEVLVDGKSRGVSPPLRALEIAPGSHTVELRNSTFPSHVEKIEVKAGAEVRIRHRFGKKK
jgi:serine/threonine-protein kinase